MSKFRVTMKKILSVDTTTDSRVPMGKTLHRQWEIEANSEADARRKAEAALREQLPNVRGFQLEKIEEITTFNNFWPPRF